MVLILLALFILFIFIMYVFSKFSITNKISEAGCNLGLDKIFVKMCGEKDSIFIVSKDGSIRLPNSNLDLSKISIEFNPKDNVPNEYGMKGKVYLIDVYNAAKNANVNYYLLLAIGAHESGDFQYNKNLKGSGAHGVMQMFPLATIDVYDKHKTTLKQLFPEKMKDINNENDVENKIYNDYFLSWNREDVKMQLQFGAYYIRIIEDYLKYYKKPYDVRTVIQAYHDGIGHITKDGNSIICEKKPESCSASNNYYANVMEKYDGLIT